MKITLTREGRRFIIALIVVAFASFNTANNLMYLILALMLSATVLSVVAAFLTLKGIDVDMRVKEPLYANSRSPVEFVIRNSKRYLSSYSLRIILPDIDDKGIYVQRIQPQREALFTSHIVFNRRGIYRISDIVLLTSFPFIFFVISKRLRNQRGGTSFIVYPTLMDVTDEVERLITEIQSSEGLRKGAEEEEFQGIRDYQYGDSLRSIHWKATARTGNLMVKEYHEGVTQRITIVLDSLRYPDAELLERAVSFASSLSVELLDRNFMVRFVTCQKSIPPGSGTEQLYKILDHLALLKESDDINCPFTESLDDEIVFILSGPDSQLMCYSHLSSRLYYASDL